MSPSTLQARPEALADVPGTGDLSLTRAILQYRPTHELEPASGRIDDIGLGLVLDGEYAASAEVLDLGSAQIHHLDLGAELVILDWVYEPTLDYVRLLLHAPHDLSLASGEVVPGPLRQYCQAIALGVLRRTGFSPLTRPTYLRIGFRDIARDLDLHEETTVRIRIAPGDTAEFLFHYDDVTLHIRRRQPEPNPTLERNLLDAFPTADPYRVCQPDHGHHILLRFPNPLSLHETITLMDQIRTGLLRLFARYEPERYPILRRTLDVFGPRSTLHQLHRPEPATPTLPLRPLYHTPTT